MFELLKGLFGKDIRSVRVMNAGVHLMWTYLIVTQLAGLASVNLPSPSSADIATILGLSIATVIVTLYTFIFRTSLKAKYVSFTLGSLTQVIIGIQYLTLYPPLDIMVVVSIGFSIWLFLCALYMKLAHKRGML